MYQLTQPSFIKGHDRGQSVGYPPANPVASYWSFGDTGTHDPQDPDPSHDAMSNNTFARTADPDITNNISTTSWQYDNMSQTTHRPGDAVTMTAGQAAECVGCRTWGGMIAADPGNNRLIMIYHVVKNFVNADGDFVEVDRGYGIATRSMSAPDNPWQARDIANLPSGRHFLWTNLDTHVPDKAHPAVDYDAYATGITVYGNFLYAYSCSRASYDGACKIAKVSVAGGNPGALLDRAQWQFWDRAGLSPCGSEGWTTSSGCADPVDGADAQPLTNGAGGMSVAYNTGLGQFLQIYASGGNVRYRVSPNLTGPWSRSGLIFRSKDGHRAYAAYPHPEFDRTHPLTQWITYYYEDDTDPATPEVFRMVKVELDPTESATDQRWATAEAYFGEDSGTLKINAYGPTTYDSTVRDTVKSTAGVDRQASVFKSGAGLPGNSVIARLESQSAGTTLAMAGVEFRNKIDGIHHNADYFQQGRGWVVLARRAIPSGGLVFAADSDGDHDLDLTSPISLPTSYNSQPIWLGLSRSATAPDTFTGYYSPSGLPGSWVPVGSVTLPAGYANPSSTDPSNPDIGVFSSGVSGTSGPNLAVFTGFAQAGTLTTP